MPVSNKPQTAEVTFSDPCYKELGDEIKGLAAKLSMVAAGMIANRPDLHSPLVPNRMELTPEVDLDGPKIFVRSWLETAADQNDQVGIISCPDFAVIMVLEGEEAFLQNTDNGNHYPLTSRETLLMHNFVAGAIAHALSKDNYCHQSDTGI